MDAGDLHYGVVESLARESLILVQYANKLSYS